MNININLKDLGPCSVKIEVTPLERNVPYTEIEKALLYIGAKNMETADSPAK